MRILYATTAAATTISTANKLYSTLGFPTASNNTSLVGTATGWGELWARGNSGAWAALGSIGAASGRGFLLDDTSLEGSSLLAGFWAASLQLAATGAGAVPITAIVVVRAFKVNAGVYTLLTSLTSNTVIIGTSNGIVWPNGFTSLPAAFATGDKLYFDRWVQVLSATGATASLTIRTSGLSTDTGGLTGSGNAEFITPGTVASTIPTVNNYGASVDSTGDPTTQPSTFSAGNMWGAMQNSGTTVARYQIQWAAIEQAVQTTSRTAISAPGTATITLDSVPANFTVGTQLLVGAASTPQETITISGLTGNALTATFTKVHTAIPYPLAVIPQAGDTPASSGSPARVQAYNWGPVDDYVATCQVLGLGVEFVLQNAPAWHQQALAIDSGKNVPVAADAGAFVTLLMARYGNNAFYAFDLNNEGFNSNLLTSSNASLMFNQMLALYQAVQPVVKAASSSTVMVAAADLNASIANVQAWFTGFYAAGCQAYVDVLNFHFYNGNNAPDAPNPGNYSYGQWWTAIQAISTINSDSTRKIWTTETGWTLLKGSNGGVPDATLAGYLNTLLNSAIFSGVVKRVCYYDLGSLAPGSGSNQNFSNQSYQTWKSFISLYPSWPNPALAIPVSRRNGLGLVAIARRDGTGVPAVKRRG